MAPTEELIERVTKAMYDDYPMRAISPALAEMAGVPVNDPITWERSIEIGADHAGLRRLARAAIAALERDRSAAAEPPSSLQPVPCAYCQRIPVVTRTATQFLIRHDTNDGAAVTCPLHSVVLPSWGEHADDAVRVWNEVMGLGLARPPAPALAEGAAQ